VNEAAAGRYQLVLSVHCVLCCLFNNSNTNTQDNVCSAVIMILSVLPVQLTIVEQHQMLLTLRPGQPARAVSLPVAC